MLKYLVDIELAFGTWPYECHIATQYVVELGQLVQMVCTDETTYLCQTRIVVTPAMAKLRSELFGIQTHGTELIDIKRAAKPTDTFLLENSTSSIFPANGNITNQE